MQVSRLTAGQVKMPDLCLSLSFIPNWTCPLGSHVLTFGDHCWGSQSHNYVGGPAKMKAGGS